MGGALRRPVSITDNVSYWFYTEIYLARKQREITHRMTGRKERTSVGALAILKSSLLLMSVRSRDTTIKPTTGVRRHRQLIDTITSGNEIISLLQAHAAQIVLAIFLNTCARLLVSLAISQLDNTKRKKSIRSSVSTIHG